MSVASKNLKASYLGGVKLQISRFENKSCHFYLVQPHRTTKQSINHHILLLDVSASMEYAMEELKIRTKLTLQALKIGHNNYVSLIIYSGHDESYRLINAVKCDTTSYKMARVMENLDDQLYTRSITVMSEPLEKAIEIVRTLGGVCNKHHIVLFTDGCLVPNKWSVKEEEAKVMAIAEICHDKGIFFNAVGFGEYYDRQFLKKIVETIGTGNLNHINDIHDFYKTMITLTKNINYKHYFTCDVTNEDYFILNTAQRKRNPEKIQGLANQDAMVMVTFDSPLMIEGKTVPVNDSKLLDEGHKEDFLYALALYHVLNDDIESSELALAQTGDLSAYLSLSNNYSFIEKGNTIYKLSELINYKGKRFSKGKVAIKLTGIEQEPLCLLEILQEILQDNASKLLWDYSYPYKNIGPKTVLIEDQYHFIKPVIGYGAVSDITIASKKLDIGVKVKVEGAVIDEETKLKLDAHIFRDYNLVVNGNINTPFMWCTLSKSLKKKFRKQKLIKFTHKIADEEIITLDLRNVRVTNKRLAKSLPLVSIAHTLYRLEQLRCIQWAIRQCMHNIKPLSTCSTLSKPNKEIMARYRVNASGIYQPREVQYITKENVPYEIYPAKILEWKIDNFPEKSEEGEALAYYQSKITGENSDEALKWLCSELSTIKEEKSNLTYKVNLVRLAHGLGAGILFWEEETVKHKKQMDPVLNMNIVMGETVTVSKKTIDNITLRQDCYTILIKCN